MRSVLYFIIHLLVGMRLGHSLMHMNTTFNGTDSDMNLNETSAAHDHRETLYLLALAPYPDPEASDNIFKPGWTGGPGLIPTVRLAVDLINNRTDVLPNYRLALIEHDSSCNSVNQKGFVAYVQEIFHGEQKIVGVIGPACSGVAIQIGSLIRLQSAPIVQVTIATSPELTKREKFPYTFSTLSSDIQYNSTVRQLMSANGWKRIGVLHHGFYYHAALESIADITEVSLALYDNHMPLQQIKDSHLRVFIVLGNPTLLRRWLCLAHHERLTFPTYQFIFVERTVDEFNRDTTLVHENHHYTCTGEELVNALEGSILLEYTLKTTRPGEPTISGLNYSEYKELYRSKVDEHEIELNRSISDQDYATVYHDAVWSLALAFNASIQPLREDGLSLSDYQLRRDEVEIQKEITNVVRRQLLNVVDFHGVSGRIDFDQRTGHTHTYISVSQVHNQKDLPIISIDTPIVFYSNRTHIPDSFSIQNANISTGTFAFFLICTILLLVATVTLQFVNIAQSKHTSIRASSPTLSHVMFVGCYLLVVAMIELLVVGHFTPFSDLTGKLLCNSVVSLSHLGLSMILITMCVKMWRIYRIFLHTWKSAGDYLHNKALLIAVFILIQPVILYCVLRSAIDPLTITSTEDFKESGGVPYIEVTERCEFRWYDTLVMRLYEMTILLFILYLSFATRHVRQTRFQSTRSTSALTFCLVLLLSLTVPLHVVATLKSWPLDVLYSIQYIEVIVVLFACLQFGLLPPILALIREKRRILAQYLPWI